MKRVLTGIDAYNKMLTTTLPEKTKTYTPVSHTQIMKLVRNKLGFLGYKILNEQYICNQNGTVGTVAFVFEFVNDPDMLMSAIFINSYDKTAKFQFKLGGLSKKHGNMVIHEGFSGSYLRRKHTGSAVEIITDHINDTLNAAALVWTELLNYKHLLETTSLKKDSDLAAMVLGKLIVTDTVDSIQLSQIRDNLKSIDDSNFTLWDMYHLCAAATRNTHPKHWHRTHAVMSSTFEHFVHVYTFRPTITTTSEPECSEVDALVSEFCEEPVEEKK